MAANLSEIAACGISKELGQAMERELIKPLSPIAKQLKATLREKEKKILEAALTEMFRRVGRKYSPKATSKPHWYCVTTWTFREQAHYRRWLTQLIRREFRYRVPLAKMEAGCFILNFGWKVGKKPIAPVPALGMSDKKKKRTGMMARSRKKKK
jgi:hypothetical protein